MQFDIIIAGLDSISARRWINATLVQMVDEEHPESLKPLIDGGTEGRFGIWLVETELTRSYRLQRSGQGHLADGHVVL